MPRDLVILVPDKNTQYAIKGGIVRHLALGIRPLEVQFLTHPYRDGGVRTGGVALLALERRRFEHALLVMDYEGSGAGRQGVAELEADLDHQLSLMWGDNGKAIVIEPEVDMWMWGAAYILGELFDWSEPLHIRDWLVTKGYVFDTNGKPHRPKEALELVCRHQRIPRSSSLYEQIASRISLRRCSDSAFLRLSATLQEWFPVQPA